MNKKRYHFAFAPGVIERQPRRRFIFRHALALVAAGVLTGAAVSIGLLLGGVL